VVPKGIRRELHGSAASYDRLNYYLRLAQEASNPIIELHDDDPVYFEIMLKFCYTLEWEALPRGDLDFSDEFFENRFFAPIGVYALADKYDIPDMRVCAARAFPNPGQGIYEIDVYKRIVGAHYEQCVDRTCQMGCKIAALLIEHSRYHHDRNSRQAFILSEDFEKVAKKYPNLSTDLVFQCLKGDGRLF
jgi:hypothetical protein